jgi:hypothetical protein
MSESLLADWLKAFAATILIEAPIYALFLRARFGVARGLLMSVPLQLLTHPLLWLNFFALEAALDSWVGALVIAEGLVLVAETALLWWMWGQRLPLALAAAFTANAVSTLVGVLR